MERILTLRFDPDSAARIAAITGFGADLGLDVRGALNPLIATKRMVFDGPPPAGTNVAREIRPGADLSEAEAYDTLVAAGTAPARLTLEQQRTALAANIVDGKVGGIPVAELNNQDARDKAYNALEAAGTVPVAATDAEAEAALAAARFFDVYAEPDVAVTDAANAQLRTIGLKVGAMQAADLGLEMDQQILSVKAPTERWPKELMWLPGFLLFGAVVWLQRRRVARP